MNELSPPVPPTGVEDLLLTDQMSEANWVRVSELIDSDGNPSLVVTHSEMLTPWTMQGMLGAAYEFQKTVVTNIFYGQTYEDMVDTECIDGTCDCEDDDGLEGDEIWGTP